MEILKTNEDIKNKFSSTLKTAKQEKSVNNRILTDSSSDFRDDKKANPYQKKLKVKISESRLHLNFKISFLN